MTARLRVVAWEVRPVVVVDDGENLAELPIQAPARIPVAGWQAFKDGGDETALEQLRGQVEHSAEPT